MINKNKSLKWLQDEMKDKISIVEEIKNFEKEVRGVYGIFVEDKNKRCVYVGKSNSIYNRMFGSNGHITELKKNMHTNSELKEAMKDPNKKIIIEILEKVSLEFDDYHKDMQRLATAENYHIDKYQNRNQCLEQVPEGTTITEDEWKSKKLENCN